MAILLPPAWSAQRIPTAVNLGFFRPEPLLSFQVAPQLSSRGWVDHVPDPLLLRKSCRAGNWTRDLWICSQEIWPLAHRGGRFTRYSFHNIKPSCKQRNFVHGMNPETLRKEGFIEEISGSDIGRLYWLVLFHVLCGQICTHLHSNTATAFHALL
jgi:hypothetical protein